MSTHEPPADRVSSPVPDGTDTPTRSAAVSGAVAVADTDAEAGRGDGSDAAPGDGREAGGGAGSGDGAVDLPAAGAGAGAGEGGREPAEGGRVEGGPADGDPAEEGNGGRVHRLAREVLLLVGICVGALLVVNAFVARPFVVPSGSMQNTLRPGDRLVVNRLAYTFGDRVQRGDVVVFDGTGSFLPYAAEPGAVRGTLAELGLLPTGNSVFVKRVIGVGGDRIACCGTDGRLRVNGVPLDETGYLAPDEAPSAVPFDVVVPPGKLWVMGDHRSASSDSRDHLGEPGGGTVPEKKVIGRAEWVVFPIGRWRSLDRPAAFSAIGGTSAHGNQG
ncbi:signal peptidase I [Kitasatospora sp. NPDC094015]|uniref:signal peptidase I n=1 Tax=Kitasatospora sp. NPDC094015 TaxID=3155205 RepID=UPI00332F7C21